MHRAANQALRSSAGSAVFNGADLRGLLGFAGTPDNSDHHSKHTTPINARRPRDCFVLDGPEELETNADSALCRPGMRQPDFHIFGRRCLARRKIQELVKTLL